MAIGAIGVRLSLIQVHPHAEYGNQTITQAIRPTALNFQQVMCIFIPGREESEIVW